MSTDISKNEPFAFTAGDTVKWQKNLPDYPVSAGWVLSYAFVGSAGQFTVTGGNDGNNHTITISSATSSTYAAGDYQYQSYVSNGSERYQIGSGTIEIKADFTSASASDTRSHVKKTLDSLEAVIEGRATQIDISYSIAGRSISKMSLAELIDARREYSRLYRQEIVSERRKRGLSASPIRQHIQIYRGA